jgi:alpha-1,3-rhamnosyl/mannosyltransferase
MDTIGVNLLWLDPGVVGGSEEYTLSLLRAVHELDPLDLELRLFVRKSLCDHHPDLEKRFEILTAPRVPGGKVGRVLTEHTWLSRQSATVSLVHHAGGLVPAWTPSRSMLTILDLQPLDMPENFGVVKRNWLGQMIPRSIKSASTIVTPSRFTASRIADLFDVVEERIHVVPFGLEPGRRPMSAPPGDGPVFLYPAIAYPHKRHTDLIEAVALVREEHPDTRLILTGGEGPLTADVRAHIDGAGLESNVSMTGRIPRHDLLDLMGSVTAVVIPSEYEGFGLPALEAMSLGTPVIVADAGSSPEVVGEAGIVVPARQPAALARAMSSLIVDPQARLRLSEAGMARAAGFEWRRSGQALISAYRDALAAVHNK